MNDEIYKLIGMIIENVQNIEYQLIRVFELNNLSKKNKYISPYIFQAIDYQTEQLTKEMSNMTFGRVMGMIRKKDYLSVEDINDLESLLSKRNQLVHQFFKYNEMNHSDELAKLNYLQNFFQESKSFSEYIKEIIDDLEDELNVATGKKGD